MLNRLESDSVQYTHIDFKLICLHSVSLKLRLWDTHGLTAVSMPQKNASQGGFGTFSVSALSASALSASALGVTQIVRQKEIRCHLSRFHSLKKLAFCDVGLLLCTTRTTGRAITSARRCFFFLFFFFL